MAEPVYHLLAAAQLGGIVEVRHIGEFVLLGKRGDDFLVNLVADVALTLERNHVFETGTPWDSDGRVGLARILVADVLNKEQDQYVVLVLAGVHAAAQLVAA
jgi:hypothetical protein